MNDEIVEVYFREIKALLLCSKEQKDELLLGLKSDVEDFIEEHPDATLQDLKDHFGTPKSIADSYQSTVGESEIRKKFHYSRRMAYIIGAAVSVLFLVIFVGFVLYFAKLMKDVPEYYVVEETVMQSVPSELSEELDNNSNTVWGK